ncbi:MAG: 3-phosphoshikimate 1-carboxyvinyltransferase [Anaerococcus sp.]|nr:3-phosphoshikimate 1-carboxyvinyltransferase [Anaerococcus sp.]
MIRIKPTTIDGEVQSISSKSYVHRALICASLAEGKSKIYFNKSSLDIEATISCLRELGANIISGEDFLEVTPIKTRHAIPRLDCKESGSTLRFLLPLAAALYEQCYFMGEGRLPDRPIKDLVDIMKANKVNFSSEKLPIMTENKFDFASARIRADISSQYISGLIFAALSFDHPSELVADGKLVSRSYLELTMDMIKKFSGKVAYEDNIFRVYPTRLQGIDYKAEGDWSNATFFLVAGALNKEVTVKGLNPKSLQGDRAIIDILKDYGARIEIRDDSIRVGVGKRNNLTIDIDEIPDMLPALAILASGVVGGKSTFYNAKRLRIKESDRLSTTCQLINNLGGRAVEKEDSLEVYGTGGLRGGRVDSHNDHRIAMAAAIGSLIATSPIEINNHRAINKSYPDFYEDFVRIGGQIDI